MREKREIRSVKDLILENEALHAENEFLQNKLNLIEEQWGDDYQ